MQGYSPENFVLKLDCAEFNPKHCVMFESDFKVMA